jgi:dihydroorotate dehydrogenase electron transfer subunit
VIPNVSPSSDRAPSLVEPVERRTELVEVTLRDTSPGLLRQAQHGVDELDQRGGGEPQNVAPGLLRQAQHGVDKLDHRGGDGRRRATAEYLAARETAARQRAFAEADERALEGLVSVRPRAAVARPQPVWDAAEVLVHEPVGERYRRLVLASATIARTAQAGQFLMVTVPPHSGDTILLPRPMAIHRRRPAAADMPSTVELIYGIVGRGTRALAAVPVGGTLQLTGPLGRGFEFPVGTRSAVLIGRGVGVCGVMGAAEDAAAAGIRTTMVLSGRSPLQLLGRTDCAELGVRVIEATDDDGSSDLATLGERLRGHFDSATPDRTPPDVVMVCGAGVLARLAAELGAHWGVPVQASLEAHMACGLGYCHGCAAPVRTDPSVEGPLVCADGPVFDAAIPVV